MSFLCFKTQDSTVALYELSLTSWQVVEVEKLNLNLFAYYLSIILFEAEWAEQ